MIQPILTPVTRLIIIVAGMLLSLLHSRKAFSSLFTSDALITNIRPDHDISHTLGRLFSDKNKVMTLAKSFRIFSAFFSPKYFTRMLASQDMEHYLEYIENGNNNINEQKPEELRTIVASLELTSTRQERMLQCYISYLRSHENLAQSDSIMEILDIRHPENWFDSRIHPKRRFIFHHGPTNSGKTFNAINELKSLSCDEKGVYMAPLRLLAEETYRKLGKCNLVTGQEKDYQFSNLTSCTIQALKINDTYDVAVIDQIQMIGDECRGWSWTAAVLGLKALKIHMCGDSRAINLVSKLIRSSGGTLQEKVYARLSKLKLTRRIFKLKNIQPGDCIIDFSSSLLYQHRLEIDRLMGSEDNRNRTAIIYGKMPPSCRKQQAEKFNSGQLPYLVASDAIGMGLNLKIKRIIFNSVHKPNALGQRIELADHQIRQIAGRAGRGMKTGYVMCRSFLIRQRVEKALRNVNISIQEDSNQENKEIKPPVQNDQIKKTSFFPQQTHKEEEEPQEYEAVFDESLGRQLNSDEQKVNKAALYFPFLVIQRLKIRIENLMGKRIYLSEALSLIENLSQSNEELYFVEKRQDFVYTADRLEHLNLDLKTQFLFAMAPTMSSYSKMNPIFQFARQFKEAGKVMIPKDILQQYRQNFDSCKNCAHMRKLQTYFLILETYTWLWNYFQLYFPQYSEAEEIKKVICEKISSILQQPQTNMSSTEGVPHNMLLRRNRKQVSHDQGLQSQ